MVDRVLELFRDPYEFLYFIAYGTICFAIALAAAWLEWHCPHRKVCPYGHAVPPILGPMHTKTVPPPDIPIDDDDWGPSEPTQAWEPIGVPSVVDPEKDVPTEITDIKAWRRQHGIK